jgi:hypothetical protein
MSDTSYIDRKLASLFAEGETAIARSIMQVGDNATKVGAYGDTRHRLLAVKALKDGFREQLQTILLTSSRSTRRSAPQHIGSLRWHAYLVPGSLSCTAPGSTEIPPSTAARPRSDRRHRPR